jgi:tripartite-type tricarboxylate transporter receptor subunit TctC
MGKLLRLSSAALAAVLFAAFLSLQLLPPRALGASHTFYEGKTIRIIVGLPPGGGVDIRARIFARHLPKWIPGNPRVIVQNMLGAAGLVAANYAFAVAKPDGLTIHHFPASTVMDAFLAPDRVKYDPGKLHILRASGDIWLTVINPKTTQVRDAKALPRAAVRLAVGATAPTSPAAGPTIWVRRASTFMCTSSSCSSIWKTPCSR